MKIIHGRTYSREWRSWQAMKSRCLRKTDPAYPRYGGRGISICQEWIKDFVQFYEDMGQRPDGCSIERINNDSHYMPGNCKWATPLEQSANRRNVIMVGDIPLKRFCFQNGLGYHGVRRRLKKMGLSLTEALKARRYKTRSK